MSLQHLPGPAYQPRSNAQLIMRGNPWCHMVSISHLDVCCLLSLPLLPLGSSREGERKDVGEGCTCNHAASFSCNKCCSHHHTSLSQHVMQLYIPKVYKHPPESACVMQPYIYTYGLQTPTTSLHRQHGTTIYYIKSESSERPCIYHFRNITTPTIICTGANADSTLCNAAPPQTIYIYSLWRSSIA